MDVQSFLYYVNVFFTLCSMKRLLSHSKQTSSITKSEPDPIYLRNIISAHDCRHDWARSAVKASDIKALQQAGGWSSPAMPLRYADDATIANEGVKLSR